MDREQLKGKQTPGKWIVIASWNDYVITVDGLENDVIVWQDGAYDTPTMTEADATLAAEAGNVAIRTGMWPEDLVARVKELEEALRALMDAINPINYPARKWNDPANDISERGIGYRTMPDEQAVLHAYRAILNKR